MITIDLSDLNRDSISVDAKLIEKQISKTTCKCILFDSIPYCCRVGETEITDDNFETLLKQIVIEKYDLKPLLKFHIKSVTVNDNAYTDTTFISAAKESKIDITFEIDGNKDLIVGKTFNVPVRYNDVVMYIPINISDTTFTVSFTLSDIGLYKILQKDVVSKLTDIDIEFPDITLSIHPKITVNVPSSDSSTDNSS